MHLATLSTIFPLYLRFPARALHVFPNEIFWNTVPGRHACLLLHLGSSLRYFSAQCPTGDCSLASQPSSITRYYPYYFPPKKENQKF